PEECPSEIAAIMRRALQTKPEERFESVAEFRRAIDAYLTGANRQRESERVVKLAVRRLERHGDSADYQAFGEAERLASRALSLWPGNKRAVRLRESALERMGRAALQANDLKFARVV